MGHLLLYTIVRRKNNQGGKDYGIINRTYIYEWY